MSGRISFLLNGEPRAVEGIAPTTTVLEYLRGVERACGTKEGCAEGDCGACTVVLGEPNDGGLRYRAINACIALLPQIDGKLLLTVEGLADGALLHPVQQVMVACDASQCGFCTPGFVMALFAFQHDSAAGVAVSANSAAGAAASANSAAGVAVSANRAAGAAASANSAAGAAASANNPDAVHEAL